MNKIIKFVKKNIMILIAIVVIFILFQKKESFSNSIKVYGTSWCGYTKKQLKYFEDNNIEVDYVDCAKNEENEKICKDKGIDTYPTIFVDGKKYIGFTKFDKNGKRLH